MKKWGIRITALLGLLALMILYYLATAHYYLFPNSDRLFQLKHNWLPHLDVYVADWHVSSGQVLDIYASRQQSIELKVRLLSALDEDTVLVQAQNVHFQALPAHPSIQGCNWRAQQQILIPADIRPGWYLLQLDDGQQLATTSIFVRPDSVKSDVALLLSTNTWNAYNYWGGQSIYTSANPTPTVSFQRPQLLANPLLENTWPHHQLYYQAANRDLPLYQLLDSVSSRPDVYSIEILQTHPEWLDGYKGLIMSTHSEYWTYSMLQGLNKYLAKGGSLINLAGNVAAYRAALDPIQKHMTVTREMDQLWESQDTSALRPFGTQADFLGFHTYAPYQVLVDSSWVLAGTKLSRDSMLGYQSLTYDYTYMYDSWWRNLLHLGNKGKLGAAAGLEIDNLYEGTPTNWVTVARGLNPRVEGHGEVWPDKELQWEPIGAPLGYYLHPGGGLVFSVSSMAFTGSIPLDANIRQIVLNVAQKITQLQANEELKR